MINLNDFFPVGYKVAVVEIIDGDNLFIEVESISTTGVCPICGKHSSSIHSYYQRTFYDLSLLSHKVKIGLTCRKFFCSNEDCTRKIFTERHTNFLRSYSRRSMRLDEKIEKLAFSNSAETASKLVKSIFMPISPPTILRILAVAEIDITSEYKYIGIDDWAYRKGVSYGTIICDLKTRRPIDILSNRDAKTVEDWLDSHNTVELVTRDRATNYSKAVDNKAPKAIQVADRWHLMHNMFDALKSTVDSKYPGGITVTGALNTNEVKHNNSDTEINKKLTKAEKLQQERLLKKRNEIENVKELRSLCLNVSEISRRTGISRSTINKYLDMEKLPELKARNRQSIIDPFIKTIKEYFRKGVFATDVYKLIKEEGYTGSERNVRYHLNKFKKETTLKEENNHTNKQVKVSNDSLLRILWRDKGKLTDSQKYKLDIALSKDSIAELYALTQDGKAIIVNRDKERIEAWLVDASKSGFKSFKVFAKGIYNDFNAVKNALVFDWNNGLLEGHVNRLKTIKRQMYGRADFNLLRKKVLYYLEFGII